MLETSRTHPLKVHFLSEEMIPLDGFIGICAAPGRVGRNPDGSLVNRDLGEDIRRLRDHYGVQLVVTLLERGQFVDDEMAGLGISKLIVTLQQHGVQNDWTPLPPNDVPASLEVVVGLVERILDAATQGQIVAIHGRLGRERAGLVAAACAVALGASVNEAIDELRELDEAALQSAVQQQTLRSFDRLWRERLLARSSPRAVSSLLPAPASNAGSYPQGSYPGMAPLSRPQALSLVYTGVSGDAAKAGLASPGPLREGHRVYLETGRAVIIGRGESCDLVIASSQLSRTHTLVALSPVSAGRLVVADLDSRNGTWKDGKEHNVIFLERGESFSLAQAFCFHFEG